jgi:LPXTG-motif cell wall-anchored protein
MKKLLAVLMVGLLALAFLPASHAFAQGKVVRVTLIDENGSGEDGSAQLTDQGDGTTKVELLMLNAPEGAEQPAHIHKGTCTTLDPKPAYPLETIKEGKSTTTVKVTLADLAKEKYAINVHKSAAEASVYVSCGNLPSGAAATGGAVSMDQVMTTLLDQSNELFNTIRKKEADASKNAYDLYHATFAAHEGEIKAKSPDTQAKLEDAMHEVNTALGEGNFDEAEQAAGKLVGVVKGAMDTLGASITSTTDTAVASMPDIFGQLEAAAGDLVRETTNKDKDGSQRAYDEYHGVFAANETAIKEKDAATQADLEERMHEVRDALAASDWDKASAASKELLDAVQKGDAKIASMSSGGTSGGGESLPTTGNPDNSITLALVSLALGLTGAGLLARRRAIRR